MQHRRYHGNLGDFICWCTENQTRKSRQDSRPTKNFLHLCCRKNYLLACKKHIHAYNIYLIGVVMWGNISCSKIQYLCLLKSSGAVVFLIYLKEMLFVKQCWKNKTIKKKKNDAVHNHLPWLQSKGDIVRNFLIVQCALGTLQIYNKLIELW